MDPVPCSIEQFTFERKKASNSVIIELLKFQTRPQFRQIQVLVHSRRQTAKENALARGPRIAFGKLA